MNDTLKKPPKRHFVKSKVTGGHYAFKTQKSAKPFTNKMGECKSVKLYPDDVVADVGSYVGEYSLYALGQGVRKTISFEATPQTFNLLSYNLGRSPYSNNSEAHNKAVVGTDIEFVDLYISKGIGVTNSIAKSHGKLGRIKVPTIKYEDAVRDASVVKIDVEGAEYSYNIIQPNLRAIILEFHPLVKEPWKRMAYQIMRDIESAGFNPIMKPQFLNGWDMAGSWVKI